MDEEDYRNDDHEQEHADDEGYAGYKPKHERVRVFLSSLLIVFIFLFLCERYFIFWSKRRVPKRVSMGFECLMNQLGCCCIHILEVHQNMTSVSHGCDTSNSLDISHKPRRTTSKLPDEK